MMDIDCDSTYRKQSMNHKKDFITVAREELDEFKRRLDKLETIEHDRDVITAFKREQRRRIRETVYLAVAVLSCVVTIYCNFLR